MAADGSVVIESRMDVSKADKDLAKLKTKIENLEKSISETETKRSPLAAQMAEYSAKLEEARKNLAYLKEEQAAINTAMQPGAAPEDYIAAYSNKPEVEANLKIQQAEVDVYRIFWEGVGPHQHGARDFVHFLSRRQDTRLFFLRAHPSPPCLPHGPTFQGFRLCLPQTNGMWPVHVSLC